MSIQRSIRLVGLAVPVVVAACSHAPAPAEQTYTIRGVITSLPTPERPTSELLIRHEAIPAFVGREGKIVGMESMEMPFSPLPRVSLKGLSVGQAVEFTLEVRWTPPARMNLTAIHALPPGTALDLGSAATGPAGGR